MLQVMQAGGKDSLIIFSNHLLALGTHILQEEIHKPASQKIYLFCLMCIIIFFLHVCNVNHVRTWYQQRTKDGTRFRGTGIIDGCELLCGC